MLLKLSAWLNSKREYFSGVVLYGRYGSDSSLLALFKKGPTDFTTKRLQEELTALYAAEKARELTNGEDSLLRVRNVTLKNQTTSHDHVSTTTSTSADQGKATTPIDEPGSADERTVNSESSILEKVIAPVNEALYLICKKEADDAYKKVMNKRAVLFSLCSKEDLTDPNTPDRIQAREKLSLEVVREFNDVSKLYERADHVKIHGRLPDADAQENELDVEALPDHLVKPTLDNIRKNVNKIKKRELTAERLALLQKHDENIKKLDARWLLLKPAK